MSECHRWLLLLLRTFSVIEVLALCHWRTVSSSPVGKVRADLTGQCSEDWLNTMKPPCSKRSSWIGATPRRHLVPQKTPMTTSLIKRYQKVLQCHKSLVAIISVANRIMYSIKCRFCRCLPSLLFLSFIHVLHLHPRSSPPLISPMRTTPPWCCPSIKGPSAPGWTGLMWGGAMAWWRQRSGGATRSPRWQWRCGTSLSSTTAACRARALASFTRATHTWWSGSTWSAQQVSIVCFHICTITYTHFCPHPDLRISHLNMSSLAPGSCVGHFPLFSDILLTNQ